MRTSPIVIIVTIAILFTVAAAAATAVLAQPELQLKLRSSDGLLLYKFNSAWTAVCNAVQTSVNARAICSLMGFGGAAGAEFVVSANTTGTAATEVDTATTTWLNNLNCPLSATSLTDCTFQESHSTTCGNNIAQLKCVVAKSAPAFLKHMPQVASSSASAPQLLWVRKRCSESWGLVCAPLLSSSSSSSAASSSNHTASAICHMLGYVSSGDESLTPVTVSSSWAALSDLSCPVATAASLSQCTMTHLGGGGAMCASTQALAVKCGAWIRSNVSLLPSSGSLYESFESGCTAAVTPAAADAGGGISWVAILVIVGLSLVCAVPTVHKWFKEKKCCRRSSNKDENDDAAVFAVALTSAKNPMATPLVAPALDASPSPVTTPNAKIDPAYSDSLISSMDRSTPAAGSRRNNNNSSSAAAAAAARRRGTPYSKQVNPLDDAGGAGGGDAGSADGGGSSPLIPRPPSQFVPSFLGGATATIRKPPGHSRNRSLTSAASDGSGSLSHSTAAADTPMRRAERAVPKPLGSLADYALKSSQLDLIARSIVVEALRAPPQLPSRLRKNDPAEAFSVEISETLADFLTCGCRVQLLVDLYCDDRTECTRRFGAEAMYHLGYAVFDGRMELLVAIDVTKYSSAHSFDGLQEIAWCASNSFRQRVSKVFKKFNATSLQHVDDMLVKYSGVEQQRKCMSLLRGKYGEHCEDEADDAARVAAMSEEPDDLDAGSEQERRGVPLLRFFRLSDFASVLKIRLSWLQEALRQLNPGGGGGGGGGGGDSAASWAAWSVRCSHCNKYSAVELPIDSQGGTLLEHRHSVFPGFECSSHHRHFTCIACVTKTLQVQIDAPELRRYESETFLRCSSCWASEKGALPLGTFERRVSSDVIARWKAGLRPDGESVLKYKRYAPQLLLAGSADLDLDDFLGDGGGGGGGGGASASASAPSQQHIDRVRELIRPGCPRCLLPLRSFVGRRAINCPRCHMRWCGLCFHQLPCDGQHPPAPPSGGGDDDRGLVPCDIVVHEWAKAAMVKILIYLECVELDPGTSALNELLIALRSELIVAGVWPLPEPWVINPSALKLPAAAAASSVAVPMAADLSMEFSL